MLRAHQVFLLTTWLSMVDAKQQIQVQVGSVNEHRKKNSMYKRCPAQLHHVLTPILKKV